MIKVSRYETLDDILNDVFLELLKLPFDISASRSTTYGPTSEIIGAGFSLSNSRARLSKTETKGKLFSALGELLWYLSGKKDLNFIKYYIDRYKDESEDGLTVHGGYGPRLFCFKGINQVENVIQLLKTRPSSRKAVIQLFDAQDLNNNHKEFPCTCTLQFFVRNNKLHMHVNMRSNDALWGLPHDVFAFTMIQEIIARTINVELGEYYHTVGSLHLYKSSEESTKQYLKEGFQSTKNAMPEMPEEDPWESVKVVLELESKIRNNDLNIDIDALTLHNYWKDIVKLLLILRYYKNQNYDEICNIRGKVNPIFVPYIDMKLLGLRTKIENEQNQD